MESLPVFETIISVLSGLNPKMMYLCFLPILSSWKVSRAALLTPTPDAYTKTTESTTSTQKREGEKGVMNIVVINSAYNQPSEDSK